MARSLMAKLRAVTERLLCVSVRLLVSGTFAPVPLLLTTASCLVETPTILEAPFLTVTVTSIEDVTEETESVTSADL